MITLDAFKIEHQLSKKLFIWDRDNLIEIKKAMNSISQPIQYWRRVK
jgi:hypothetical protein